MDSIGKLTISSNRLSIVIPSARAFPRKLVEQLLEQIIEGEEILVIQNLPTECQKRWAGLNTQVNKTNTLVLSTDIGAPVRVLKGQIDQGAAAARNLGWRSSRNEDILFLDDDIKVKPDFLSAVRKVTCASPCSISTFRIISTYTTTWSKIVGETLSLDRGPAIISSKNQNLKIENVWMFGTAAAMLASKAVLQATGGFKDLLGAGCVNGGTEDAEFIWHASRHTNIQYYGSISVFHDEATKFLVLSRKMMEYGRAIANLAGLVGGLDGRNYVVEYCNHLEKILRKTEISLLSTKQKSLLRRNVSSAIIETRKVYAESLKKMNSSSILCDGCR